MKKNEVLINEFRNDGQDEIIEVHLTPKEDEQLRDLARSHQISVAELLRREVLKDVKNVKLEDNYLDAVIDATHKIRKVHEAAVANGALPTIDTIGTALLEMADAVKQLTKFYECRAIGDGAV